MLCSTVPSGGIPALRASQSGTGFENPPPLAILTNFLKFLKCIDLKSVGLGLEGVPFHCGWDIVEWKSKLVDLGVSSVEILEICDEVEEKEPRVFGPQIELGLENLSGLGEPPVEAAGEVPDVVKIRDEPSVEGKAVEELGTGDSPIHGMKAGYSCFEDYPGDTFEKVGEITPAETPQIPSEPAPAVPSEETPSSTEPRRKRIKTFAGRTDLPWVRKLIAQRSQTSPSSHQSSQKQPTQRTRKSHRLAAQGFGRRSSSTKQGAPAIE